MWKIWAHFQEGGWMMYPVFMLGLMTVGAAGRFAWRGEHQLLPFIGWMLRALLGSGAFGFLVGMMRALHAAQGPENPLNMARIVLEGFAEASHVPAFALMFTAFTCILVAVGQRRFPLPNPSAVAR
jgi:hypothetical protein